MSNGPSARRLLEALVGHGTTHVVGLPDNASAPLFALLEGHDTVRSLTVTREGEAFAVASGLWIGGARPVVVVQNTGLLESGDSLRGTAVRMGVPLLVVVTWRGFAKMRAAGLDARAEGFYKRAEGPYEPTLPRELLVRGDLDSVALLTEPTLRAWGVPFARCASDAELGQVARLQARAEREQRPVALLLSQALRG